MMTSTRFFILGLAITAVASCLTYDNILKSDIVISCKTDDDCAETGQVCNMAATPRICVQCLPLPDKAGACTGVTPVCGVDNTCHACSAHSECASDACLPTGACALETEVVYLKEGGSGPGGANCTKMAPCGLLSIAVGQAMTGTRPYIRVSGMIENSNVGIGGMTLTFLGDASAVLRGQQGGGGTGGDRPIIDLSNGAKVEIYDLTLLDADRKAILADSTGATLLLQRSKVVNADEEGIEISNGSKVTLKQSEVSGCGGTSRRGVNFIEGELIVDQSKIANNGGGGILVAEMQKFTITNSFIVANRVGGGISALVAGNGSKLEFNTIVDNISGTGTAAAGGVICDGNTAVSARYNIIFRNVGGPGGTVQKLGDCNFMNGFEAVGNAGTEDQLKFRVDTGVNRDYHLTASSPSSVKDAVSCSDLVDYDGDARPQGGACDLGADEVK